MTTHRTPRPTTVARLLAATLLTLATLLFTTIAAAPTAHAGAQDCFSYAYDCTPGYTGANASGTWAWSYYGGSWATTQTGYHNCTLYAAWRLQQSGMPNPGRSWGNANQWAASIGGGDHNPVVGSIAWWSAGTYGHVAYVEQVNGTQVFIRADNWSTTKGYTTSGWIAASSVELFLHPHDNPGGGDRDADGVTDDKDSCPRYAATGDPHGCQEEGSSSHVGDFDGDGVADTIGVYYYPGSNPSMKMHIFRGHKESYIPGGPEVFWQTDGSWNATQSRFVTGDFNGDGISDLVGIYEYPGDNPAIRMHLFPGRRSGAITGPTTIHWQTDGSWNGANARFVTGDFNGDGISDIVGVYYYPGSNPSMKMHIFRGHKESYIPGGPEVFWQTDGSWNATQSRFVTGDFNGDGISDLVGIYEYPGDNPAIRMHLFPGRRSGAITGPTTIHWQTDGSWNGANARFVTGDFNGDGISDIVGVYYYPGSNPSMKMHIFRGHKESYIPGGPEVFWQTDGSWNATQSRFVTGDFNGDGISDLVGIYEYPGDNPAIRMHLFPGRRSGAITGPTTIHWQTDGSWNGANARFVTGAGVSAGTPTAPTKVDGCGTARDTYTIPAVTGVEYLAGGVVKAPGTYPTGGVTSLTITARAKTGYVLTGTTTWTLSWTTTACTTTVTGAALSTPTWTVPKATLSWTTTGAPAGTTLTYDVQYRAVTLSSTGARIYSTPTTWLTATTTTTGTLTGSAGGVYQIHARTTDNLGTIGAWSPWKTVTMPIDDRATSFAYTGTWTTGTSTSYYAGTYKLTSTAGAKVTVTAWTDQVALIGARSTTSGKATITIDGVLKATIDTYAATAAYRQTLATITIPYGKHTITVTNLATTGRPRLILDALAFRR